MRPEMTMPIGDRLGWSAALLRLALVWTLLAIATATQWAQMAHQWWNIDTYSHILLIPAIVAWLVWLRREALAAIVPSSWWGGLAWMALGLFVWVAGRGFDINLFAQAGTLMAFQGAAMAMIGLRASLLLALPIAYSSLLVPFGDEIIPQLQAVTAMLATALSHASGIATVSNGIYIDTPAGLFIVAEACSGVKFLIAMIALGILVIFTCFDSWQRRLLFLLACLVVPIVANGIRAWATIFIAQYVGAEAAGSFDHIVYGWIFFAIVIALVLGTAWRWFERDPEDAGWTVGEVERMAGASGLLDRGVSAAVITGLCAAITLAFVAIAWLG